MKKNITVIFIIAICFRLIYAILFYPDNGFPFGSLIGMVVGLWAIDKYID